MTAHNALLVVDLQNDFLPGGALAVAGGDAVIAPINRLLAERGRLFSAVVATQDWHPADHESFASQHHPKAVGEVIELHGLKQVLWPNHCVQESYGAAFSGQAMAQLFDVTFQKGARREVDSYSGFFDNGRRHQTGLHDWLQRHNIAKLAVCGLATDYCVKYTVLDALSLGYEVSVIVDAVRGVNLTPNASETALDEMVRQGATLLKVRDVLGGFW